jgi:hypothetical protein
MNAMDYMPIRVMFWFGVAGGCVVLVYTVALWLLLRGDRIQEEEERGGAVAPLLPTIPEEDEEADA